MTPAPSSQLTGENAASGPATGHYWTAGRCRPSPHRFSRAAGSLAARAGTSDIVAACVAEGAMRRHDLVISSDAGDLQAIAAAIGRHLEIDPP